jgi:multicomponent Na+:H+ antiporter subunit B
MLLVTALTIVRMRSILAVVMLSGIYSFLMASIFLVLDAVDVAFTEAAVGAGITTILGLMALSLTEDREKVPARRSALPLVAVAVTGAALLYATADMPDIGDPAAPVHGHVAPRYLSETPEAIGIPNVVTAVLADYRGFDTLGEVAVIFTAGVGVMLLLGRGRGRRREDDDEE